MNVIVLASYLSTSLGGLERSLYDVCHGLQQRGHSIILVYEKTGDQFEIYKNICVTMIKIKTYKVGNANKFTSTIKLATDIWRVAKLPIDRNNTIVYSSQQLTWFFGSAIALLKSIPFVCHIRLPAPEALIWQWNKSIKYAKQTITLNSVDKFIAVSQQLKLDLINKTNINENKIDVVHNGIHLDQFKYSDDLDNRKNWQLKDNAKIVTYVGRLDKYKGVEILIEAFFLLLKADIDANLLIAGKFLNLDEEYKNYLEQLPTKLGIEKKVKYMGHISNPLSLYQISDVNVLPSLWPEPFGRTVIESMACGVPTVASRIGGIPEILTGNFQNLLFEPGNSESLFKTLMLVINWKTENPSLKYKCREHILENFSIEKTVDGVEQSFLKSILTKNTVK